MTKEKKEVENIKCTKCGSGQTYVRLKEGTRVCRSCGHVVEIKNG